jgi:hypothetical protein
MVPSIFKKVPLIFINCDELDEQSETSYKNSGESQIVKRLATYLMTKHAISADQFGIISPYNT